MGLFYEWSVKVSTTHPAVEISGYSRFAYSRFAYSHFAYSHFAYSRFAYSQMFSLSRFAYTQDFCTLPSFRDIVIKPGHICITLMRQKKALMLNYYYSKFSRHFMFKYGKKDNTNRKIGAAINCYCFVLY